MSEVAHWLDGNALGGLLEEMFGMELTAWPHRCPSCGESHAVGAHRLYRGAGLILRCPGCGALALTVATLPDHHLVHLEGGWRIGVSRSSAS
jgi:predicted RNA-binding Zn-ribbon protein involved in translation (DUF1610 family)